MNILIIGGGISGISAAKVALAEDHMVTVLESEAQPGGLMARIANCRVGFKSFFDEIQDQSRLNVIAGAWIVAVTRKEKVFSVLLEGGRELTADRVIIAAGLSPHDPAAFTGKRVLRSLEYDAIIDQRNGELPPDFNKVAFVMCVGSRSEEYPLCSSVCCSYTLREIKWTLQRSNPEITVFYNDLRFFGKEYHLERFYRNAGVRFIRANSRYFDEDEEGVTLRYFSEGELKEERFNYVVLAVALRPNPLIASLSRLFGFAMNEYGFVKENEPLTTNVEGVYVSGGALEPMNIKDAILTGFGAGMLAIRNGDFPSEIVLRHEKLYKEGEPEVEGPAGDDCNSCLFYLGTEDPGSRIFYEYMSSRFIAAARGLAQAGKTVYVATRNMVTPSYEELDYEKARREGVIFFHLEEDEQITFEGEVACIEGRKRELKVPVDRVFAFDDYVGLFKDREFLSVYRSEPQLRWSPTKWGRKKYHVGFIRHPRARRWEQREILGACGEMLLDLEQDRVLPEVNDEKCSGCGSCKNTCPQHAIEVEFRDQPSSVFGPFAASVRPVAQVDTEACASCGLCASICPSHAMGFDQDSVPGSESPRSFTCDAPVIGLEP
jgi:thioredoxin reductase/Pyruvate/2-oxoacid:ferredoxin oxidoreductase delta subunit